MVSTRRLGSVSLCSALLLAACSAFQGRRVTNLAPFAENTMALVSSLRLTFPRPAHIRGYLANNEDVREARAEANQLRQLMRGVIVYSMQVASIDNSDLDQSAKAHELARFLDEGLRPAIRSQDVPLSMTEAQLDSVLDRVRTQDKYLGALREANAIVTLVVETADEVVSATEAHIVAATATVAAAIESDFAPQRANAEGLRTLEARTLRTYVLLSRARLADSAALRELHDTEPTLGLGEHVAPEELTRLERETSAQLETIRQLREQVQPEVELYANRVQELDEMAARALASARETRASFILWGRAHRNMAAGIALPPEIDVTHILKGAAEKLPGM